MEDHDQTVADRISESPILSCWMRSGTFPYMPAVILDRKMRILWSNDSFQGRFGRHLPNGGTHLTKLYYEYLGEERVNNLYQSVSSAENGYSWYGRVERKGSDQTTIIANLFIFPLYLPRKDNGRPIAYFGVFDDVSDEYQRLLQDTFQSLLRAAKLKDNDTGNHIERVNRYARVLAVALQADPEYSEVDQEFVRDIGFLAAMHDVGKIGIPDDILNKAGPLEDWEWDVMQSHTINGAFLLGTYPNPVAAEVALRHHEKWDGAGYPHGLSGATIPLSARIVAVADVYDALRMKRHYKPAFSHKEAYELVVEGDGAHFDPKLILLFKEHHEQFRSIFDDLTDG